MLRECKRRCKSPYKKAMTWKQIGIKLNRPQKQIREKWRRMIEEDREDSDEEIQKLTEEVRNSEWLDSEHVMWRKLSVVPFVHGTGKKYGENTRHWIRSFPLSTGIMILALPYRCHFHRRAPFLQMRQNKIVKERRSGKRESICTK